ncbi:MAG: right-handed parallel beta-helix repeat-containing protein [Promethearchaeota archaeon]
MDESLINRINIETPENIILKISSNGQIIIINSNYELNQTASSGNGTLANPYIIRDKKIDANGNTYGILINNTNKFFSLINCTVFNASYGLFIHNVSKGKVYDCYFRDNSIAGIKLFNCSKNAINYNYIYSNNHYGIVFNRSNNNEISGNYLWDNQHSGIYLNCSNYNNITSNLLTNHDNAIYLLNSNHSYIAYNFGSSNNHTIVQINCVDNTLVKNFIEWSERANTEIKFLSLVISCGMLSISLARKYNTRKFLSLVMHGGISFILEEPDS